MALFKKRDDSGIPKIPPLPEFRGSSTERGLPSLPGSFNEDVNRNIIKSAMSDEHEDFQEGAIPSLPKRDFEEVSSENERFLPGEESLRKEEPALARETRSAMEGPDSIFVRIDKFKSAKKELTAIKKGLLEAEAVINKINEIKIKEDSEIKDINLNLDNIKKKIGEVDSLVFDKV
jgi:soluble cytochrome b562